MNHDLFYFNSKKQGELDFVVEKDGEFLPIEVKSGKDNERHRALCNVMENEEYAVPHAFVLCLDNVQVNGKVAYLPIYMLMFMHQSKVEDVIYRFQPRLTKKR